MDEDSDPNRILLILAFSGGGTRAAALAYGVLRHLDSVTLPSPGTERRTLLDEVDVISSVSGGSFTAAYYGLFRKQIFESFETDFLEKNVKRGLWLHLFNPVNLLRLPSPHFDRVHVAADYIRRDLFNEKTFADLKADRQSEEARSERPFIVINATDVASGARFEFTQAQFDPLCLDLSSFRVADAVAASSAYPGGLSPMTIRSRAGECDRPGDRQWKLLRSALAPTADRRRFYWALSYLSYLAQDQPERLRYFDEPKEFIHLLDGGIADNTGARAVLEALTLNESSWFLKPLLGTGDVEHLVVISSNATAGKEKRWSRARAPLINSWLVPTVVGSVKNRYSFEMIEQTEEELRHLDRKGPDGAKVYEESFYPIEVGFDRLDQDTRRRLVGIKTDLHLPEGMAAELIDAARTILCESKPFRKLIENIGGVEERPCLAIPVP